MRDYGVDTPAWSWPTAPWRWFRPERAFAIIEREEEFANRATRWVFDT